MVHGLTAVDDNQHLVAGLEGGLVTAVSEGTGVQPLPFRLLLAFGGYCLSGIIVV